MSDRNPRRALLVLALSALAACGGEDASDVPPEASPPPVALPAAATPDSLPGDDGSALDPAQRARAGSMASGVDASRPASRPDTAPRRPTPEERRAAAPPPVRVPDERPVFERPEHVRGVYLNKWAAGSSRRVDQLVGLARRTEVNAFVIDVKDATGYLSYASGVDQARRIGATEKVSIADLPGLLRRLADEGIWPIARIVIVKDPILAAARPDLAIQDTAGGPWKDRSGTVWMNPWSTELRDYHMALAREAVALGFPEIQWDYVRFPDASRAELARATYPGADGRGRPVAIRAFLSHADSVFGELGVLHSADVFGVTTSARDVGIGQIWEEFIDRLDVALPMVYPSHYAPGSFGYRRPNARPYEIVKKALGYGQQRSRRVEGAGSIRPWLQDFTLGEPDYGVPEVLAQIQAAYDLGIEEWVLWNPGSRYTEGALRPVGGWRDEPLIRVADLVVPLSERHEAIRWEAARAAEAEAERARGAGAPGDERERLRRDTVRVGAPAESARGRRRPRVLDRDSLRHWLDSVRAPPDTLPGGR